MMDLKPVRIVCRPRGYGKTTEMIKLSIRTGVPILVVNNTRAKLLRSMCERMGFDSESLLIIVGEDNLRGTSYSEVIIDELEDFFKQKFGVGLRGFSISGYIK